jgi:ssDNA thymidine ADP-ribosyltransferase, DarT
MTPPPAKPKIYHIVHVDRLASILADGFLFSDATMASRADVGTIVGMGHIKERRLSKALTSHLFLTVGGCVPFYFCPRAVMLYILHKGHSDLAYKDGQPPIIHLEADFYQAVAWAKQHQKRWAFTLSNAGAYYFEDRADVSQLKDINWEAVKTNQWSGQGVDSSTKDGKQAEFLLEECFPWQLFSRIGVHNKQVYSQVQQLLQGQVHQPTLELKTDWYY